MAASYAKQKEEEKRTLEAARRVCSLLPPGEVFLSEEPDLRIRIDTGWLGVEVTELIRSNGENRMSPVQDETFHREVMRLAQELYYGDPKAPPVCVTAYFLDEEQCKRENPDGWLRLTDKKTGRKLDKMTASLVDFVRSHPAPGTFALREMPGQAGGDALPTGFEVIGISGPPDVWRSGESASSSGLKSHELGATIGKKNNLLPKYRVKAPDMPIWLLIYISPAVARDIPLPCNIAEWTFAFDFEKVLLFSAFENRVYEIRRMDFKPPSEEKPPTSNGFARTVTR